ncbi:MAG: glycosyltransferase [bacterium]|nr:glycosyltransferase [bacterium]
MGATVLIVWHGALFPSYRKPFRLLQERHGWNVHLLAARSWSKAMPRATRFVPEPDEPITLHVQRAWGAIHGAVHLHPLLPLLMRQVKPDVLYVIEEPFSLMAWLCAYMATRGAPPIPYALYTFQDIYKKYPPPFRWMERFTLRHAARVLCSNAQAGGVAARKGYTSQWDVLPPPVNLDRFTYRRPRPGDGMFAVGYVGRLADEKGLDTLLWALSYLNDEVRLRIAGDGPARHRLDVLARELGVAERVAFMGPLPHEELAAFYHECDAVVLPSRARPNWQEQFGRVLIEAMACGAPVIGSQSGAIPGVIGDAGLLFPEGDAQALADKISWLADDARLRDDLSLRGRVRAEQQYSAERIAQRLNEHLSGILNAPAKHSQAG